MITQEQLLEAIVNDPLAVRTLLSGSEVSSALSSIGVLPKILELHAPSDKSRNSVGLGPTACGITGTRHTLITCRRCKQHSHAAVVRSVS